MSKILTDSLISSIHKRIKDYRSREKTGLVKISEDRIRFWIRQFEVKHRKAVLTELNNIFKKRYCSRRRAKKLLHDRIVEMSTNFGYRTPLGFLKHAQFLNLQQDGKSQGAMLDLLDEVLHNEFKYSIAQCASKSKSYSIYLDDMLCTGNTLMKDILFWEKQRFFGKKTNRKAVEDGSTVLVLCYIFVHNKNYNKKLNQLSFDISRKFSNNIHTFYHVEVNNTHTSTSKLDVIYPLRSTNAGILTYEKEVNAHVDEYLEDKGYKNKLGLFYRSRRWPVVEEFFTSTKNREIVESALLTKGIEILKKANAQKNNIRALGFSLPSVRNFGFGTLCFTWRNISNNTPLVFWYSASSFTPLFKKREYE